MHRLPASLMVKITNDVRKHTNNQLKVPSIYYTNCRSLNDIKFDDLKLHTSSYDPDGICLTEIWFTMDREANTNIPGYTVYTANR